MEEDVLPESVKIAERACGETRDCEDGDGKKGRLLFDAMA